MRMGAELYKGISVLLRTGIEKYDICDEQRAWESRNVQVFVLLVRTGVEIHRGMSVPLRTGGEIRHLG